MRCKQVLPEMYPLLRREISGEKRMLMFDHIQNCSSCREQYKQLVGFTWKTELEKIKPVAQNQEIKLDISEFKKRRMSSLNKRNRRWIYAVAAIMIPILVFLLIPFSSNTPTDDITLNNKASTDQNEIDGEQSISLNTIQKNLEQLKSAGIEKINLDLVYSELQTNAFNENSLKQLKYADDMQSAGTTIAVDDAIKKVKLINRFKKDVSISELLGLYYQIVGGKTNV